MPALRDGKSPTAKLLVDNVPRVVPQPNSRVRQIMFVTEGADARRTQQETSTVGSIEPDPASGKDSQEMSAGENKNIVADSANSLDDAIGSCRDVAGQFAAGATVEKQLPVGILVVNVDRAPAFVFAIVPLDQFAVAFGLIAKAGQFTSALRPYQRTGENFREANSTQSLLQRPSHSARRVR